VGINQHDLTTDTLQGPVKAVSPKPVTNQEYTQTLGQVLKLPTVFWMPILFARIRIGEMADALLLSSTRVEPAQLSHSGYEFQFPELDGALRHVLGKPSA
jgi:NAD dependent epimerase/dehydratase family enzyme